MAVGLNHTGSLNAFYDEIVFHEMANGRNRFFVTFEKGNFGFPNDQRESIATAEIDYPHVSFQTGSISPSGQRDHVLRRPQQRVTFPRRGYSTFAFLEEEEKAINSSARFQNNGHITTTQLKGDRFFRSTLTSSVFKAVDVSYEHYNPTDNTSHISRRVISGSYFFPFSQYQLGVLRNTPTLVLNLHKKDELPEGMSGKGFVIVPENTDQRVLDNLEFYLAKAGLINISPSKVGLKPETGGGGPLQGTIAQGMDIYGQQSGYAPPEDSEEDDDIESPDDGIDQPDGPTGESSVPPQGGLFGGGLFGPGGFNPPVNTPQVSTPPGFVPPGGFGPFGGLFNNIMNYINSGGGSSGGSGY